MKSLFSNPLVPLLAVVAVSLLAAAVAEARERRAVVAAPEKLDLEALLWAIRQVESGDNPHAIGPKGERSAYQFMLGTWAQYTTAPFELGSQVGPLAHQVARKHALWILREMAKQRLGTDVIFFAAAWHHGLEGATREARCDYARRVQNLYLDRIEQRTEGAP